jgi:hypothetical protein
VRVVQVGWFELSVHMFDLLALHSMSDLSVEAISRAYYCDFGIGI